MAVSASKLLKLANLLGTGISTPVMKDVAEVVI